MSLHAGQRVGPYVVESLLGAGAMATVWRAWDERHAEHVAIKIMADGLAEDAQLMARFIDELRRHAKLHHPHIVAVRDVFSIGGQPCMVMDLVPGGSLEKVLDTSPGRRLSLEASRPLMLDVLSALDYAHRKGIVHRDVKPSNILLDAQHEHAWLSDFGIALTEGERRRTRVGVSVGTNAYMSPEQIRAETIDFRSDVYAMGCVMYETLTGQPPFVAATAGTDAVRAAVLAAHLNEQPVAPRHRDRAMAPQISKLIMRALEKNPERRVPGCAEFARLLNLPTPDSGRTFSLTGRAAAILVGLAVLVIVFVTGVIAFAAGK
jgi:serine/threonine protein kinase